MLSNGPIFPWTTISATAITQEARFAMREHGARVAMREWMGLGGLESLRPRPILSLREFFERPEETPAPPYPNLVDEVLDLGSEFDEEETPKEKLLDSFDYEIVEPWKGLSDPDLRELDNLRRELASLAGLRPVKGLRLKMTHGYWGRLLRSAVMKTGSLPFVKEKLLEVKMDSINDKAILAGLVYCVFIPLEDLLESSDPAGAIAARNYARHVYTQVQKKCFRRIEPTSTSDRKHHGDVQKN